MTTNERPVGSALLALAGLLSLATAIGIGRFAFTPLLPLMLREDLIDVAQGGWLAAANYAGYLAGALAASRIPLRAGALAIAALVATAVLTAAMTMLASTRTASRGSVSAVSSAQRATATT